MKHLTSISNLSKTQAISILDLSEDLEDRAQQKDLIVSPAKGKTVANMFFEDSTRTRISFEVAARRLGINVINFSAKGSSTSKGESLKDTIQTLEAMGVDAFVIRHSISGTPDFVANSNWSKASVINAGDGTHEHPSQALLDAYTIRKHFKTDSSKGLDGIKVLIVGDVLHSRVAKSNTKLLQLLGAQVSYCGPKTLAPDSLRGSVSNIYHDLDEALHDQFDVVMMLRLQLERMDSAFFPNPREYASLFQLNSKRESLLGSETIVMHPGPMNRGLEISDSVADGSKSVIVEQVSNGVTVRMAILESLLTSGNEQS